MKSTSKHLIMRAGKTAIIRDGYVIETKSKDKQKDLKGVEVIFRLREDGTLCLHKSIDRYSDNVLADLELLNKLGEIFEALTAKHRVID